MKKFDRALHDAEFNRTMKFTRYLYMRYYTMFLFFLNIFWIATLFTVSGVYWLGFAVIIIEVFLLRVFLELFAIQENPELEPRFLKLFFQFNVVWSILLVVLILWNLNLFFPYIKQSSMNQVIMIGFMGLSAVISGLFLNKIRNIATNTDRISKKLQQL